MSKRGRANRDSSGVIGFRAWLFSEDEHGTRIPATPSNFEGMHARESRAYVPTASVIELRAEQLGRENRIRAALNDREFAVLKAQGKLTARTERRVTIHAGELVEYQRNGYTLIPGSAHMVEREGLPAVECVEVVGYESEQVEAFDYEQVAEHLGLSVAQVHRAVKAANKKLRALEQPQGDR